MLNKRLKYCSFFKMYSRLLNNGGSNFLLSMMEKYSDRERSRIEAAFTDEANLLRSKKNIRYRKTLEPEEKFTEEERDENGDNEDEVNNVPKIFIDNKIDVTGKRHDIFLSLLEQNALLIRLVDYIKNIEGTSDEDKCRSSALYRLHKCYEACKRLVHNAVFYVWLRRVSSMDEIIINESVHTSSNVLPSKAQLESGCFYIGDIEKANELTKRSYRYTLEATVLGLRMRARSPDFSLKFNEGSPEISEHSKNVMNDLTRTWHERSNYSCWAKYYETYDADNEKFVYGQLNYFFRFRWYTGDDFISNLAIASVTSRRTNSKYQAKPNIKATSLNIIIPDASSINENILFVPLREFVSTAVAIVGFDADRNPILPTNARSNHLIPEDVKRHLSQTFQLHEMVMIDLNVSRRKLVVGTDSQTCTEDDLRNR